MKQKPTDYRNRIKALEYVDAADLTAHPGNWREHPQAQAEAMRGVLAEVGIAGALLAYRSERQGGALVVIDGHLRKDAAPQKWPVLILDVDDAEADYLLATHDPLAAMATADAGALDALLSSVQSGEAAVMEMLAELAEGAGLYPPKDGLQDAGPQIDRAEELRQKRGVELGQTWQVGNHLFYCGDSIDWPLERPDGILTDPPYDLDAGKVIAIFDGISKAAMVLTSDAQMVGLAARWPLRINLVWHHRRPNSYPTDHVPVINHSQCTLITQNDKVKHGWVRPSPGFSSIISVEREYEAQNERHGKGADIFVEMLRGFPWQVVGDPFLGTGATAIACDRLGRQCRGVEIDPLTFAVMLQRLSDALGVEPQLC